MMEAWEDDEPDYCKGDYAAGPGSKDIYVQLVISLGLGFTALFAFCVSASFFCACTAEPKPTTVKTSLY